MVLPGRAAALLLTSLYALSPAAAPALAAEDPARGGATLEAAGDASAAVREAQALMAELGLWDGAADGVLDSAFRDAAGHARRRLGIAPGAANVVDDALLNALRSRVDARRVTRRLDAARAAEVAEARAAIAAAPALAARLTPQAGDSRAAAGRDLSACRAAPTVACLLDEARESVKAVTDPELRDWGLTDIAVARVADTGSLDAAWPVLRLMDDPRAVFTALREIALAEARAGRADHAEDAARTAEPLPAAAVRAHAGAAAALTGRAGVDPAAAARLEAAAEALLPRVADPAARRAALISLAEAAAARGATDLAARRLADAETVGPADGEDLGLLAAARGRIQGPQALRPMLERTTTAAARRAVLVALAAAHAAAGDAAAARQAAAEVTEPRYRAVALADAAATLGDAGLAAQALREAAAVDLPFARAYALARVVEAWLAAGDAGKALAAARAIDDDRLRVEALRRLAHAGTAPAPLAAEAAAEADRIQAAMIDRVARLRLQADSVARAGDAAGAGDAGRIVRAAVEDALAVRNAWNRTRSLVAAAQAVQAAAAAGIAVPPPPAAER